MPKDQQIHRSVLDAYRFIAREPGSCPDQDSDGFEDVDAVVNLAGAEIGDHRWTKAYKQELIKSRTRLQHCSRKH